MEDRYLFRAKRLDNGEWVQGALLDGENHCLIGQEIKFSPYLEHECKIVGYEVDRDTICQCTGFKDKNGKLIWENDILMCHGNSEDLVKAVFGEFNLINAETLEVIDRVIGWHYEVVPTDALSKCEPFCFPMPLTEEYVKTCEMEVVDNPELLEV
nr:MAG: YopX protein [Bacteriophage sp.]